MDEATKPPRCPPRPPVLKGWVQAPPSLNFTEAEQWASRNYPGHIYEHWSDGTTWVYAPELLAFWKDKP